MNISPSFILVSLSGLPSAAKILNLGQTYSFPSASFPFRFCWQTASRPKTTWNAPPGHLQLSSPPTSLETPHDNQLTWAGRSVDSKGPTISPIKSNFPLSKAHWQLSHVHHSAARIPEKLQQVQRLNHEFISQRFHFPSAQPLKKWRITHQMRSTVINSPKSWKISGAAMHRGFAWPSLADPKEPALPVGQPILWWWPVKPWNDWKCT